jgi:SAM-dependent methyltransferase
MERNTASALGYDERFFAALEALEPRSFWFAARNELIAWALATYFPGARSLLEVGCGTGFVLAALERACPALALTGAEPFAAGLEVARRRVHRAALVQLDVRDLAYDGEFDVVATFDVLEHLDDDAAALAALRRGVRPGGGLLVTVPQHPALWSWVDEAAGHRRRYTRDGLVHAVRGAGFEPVRTTSFVSLLLPFLAASRLAGRRSGDPLAGLRLPRALDRAFAAVTAVERHAIERGVSLPAGGSLLLVARAGVRPAVRPGD